MNRKKYTNKPFHIWLKNIIYESDRLFENRGTIEKKKYFSIFQPSQYTSYYWTWKLICIAIIIFWTIQFINQDQNWSPGIRESYQCIIINIHFSLERTKTSETRQPQAINKWPSLFKTFSYLFKTFRSYIWTST